MLFFDSYLLLGIFWFACVVGAALVAPSKDEPAFGWAFMSLLLGPVALLFLVCKPMPRKG